MKQKETKNKIATAAEERAFQFIDYTDAELIAFYELIRNKVLGRAENTKHETPGLAGKYKLLLARL